MKGEQAWVPEPYLVVRWPQEQVLVREVEVVVLYLKRTVELSWPLDLALEDEEVEGEGTEVQVVLQELAVVVEYWKAGTGVGEGEWYAGQQTHLETALEVEASTVEEGLT